MTTYATFALNARLAVFAEGDCLMSTVHARRVATSTTNATVAVNLGEYDGLAVQIGGGDEAWQFFAHEVGQLADAAFLHVVLKSQYQVVNYSVAILHDGSTYLHVAAAQLNELQRIAPCLDAAYSAELDVFHDGILGHFQNVAQGNWFYGPS